MIKPLPKRQSGKMNKNSKPVMNHYVIDVVLTVGVVVQAETIADAEWQAINGEFKVEYEGRTEGFAPLSIQDVEIATDCTGD